MYALIRKWEQSEVSQSQFFKEHKISKSTFGYWRKKYLLEQGQHEEAKGKMIPVRIQAPEQPVFSGLATSLEIIYPNGVRIVCPAQMEASSVKALVF